MQTQPPKYVSPPGTWKTKLGIRAASIVFLIVLSGLAGSLAADSRLDGTTLLIVVLGPAAVVTFIWDIAESICIWKRGGHRGIHPGAVVAIDLLAWLGWGLVDLLVIPYSIILTSDYYVANHWSDDEYGYSEPGADPEYEAVLRDVHGKGRAVACFAVLTTIIHFAVFVIACYETHIRNRMPTTIYVMQPIYGPAPVQEPGAYQQLGTFPAQPVQGQPFPGQTFMPGQFPAPVQSPPAAAGDTKAAQGAERFA
ncbi:hypothetical protein L209DRAFT_752783 [Thermothelomyces heterothallicus CBS 203.75]